MGIKIARVATAIAGLTVTPATIKDISAIPEEVTDRLCPIMFPDPAGFVSGLSVSRETFGADSAASKNVEYTLNYIYLHCESGAVRYITEAIDKMVDNAVIILNAIANNSTVDGAVDITPRISGEFGQLTDPAGNSFFGCRITVNVLEYYEVS